MSNSDFVTLQKYGTISASIGACDLLRCSKSIASLNGTEGEGFIIKLLSKDKLPLRVKLQLLDRCIKDYPSYIKNFEEDMNFLILSKINALFICTEDILKTPKSVSVTLLIDKLYYQYSALIEKGSKNYNDSYITECVQKILQSPQEEHSKLITEFSPYIKELVFLYRKNITDNKISVFKEFYENLAPFIKNPLSIMHYFTEEFMLRHYDENMYNFLMTKIVPKALEYSIESTNKAFKVFYNNKCINNGLYEILTLTFAISLDNINDKYNNIKIDTDSNIEMDKLSTHKINLKEVIHSFNSKMFLGKAEEYVKDFILFFKNSDQYKNIIQDGDINLEPRGFIEKYLTHHSEIHGLDGTDINRIISGEIDTFIESEL